MQKIINHIDVSHNSFPQNPAADDLAKSRLGDPAFNPHGVYRYYDRQQSRVTIGRQQHTLAVGSIHGCLRFTDAATLFFWYYRRRPNRDPIDTDFNLGLDVARYDLKNCEWLRKHLEYVEQTMISCGIVTAASKRWPQSINVFDRERFLLWWNGFQKESEKFLLELVRAGEQAKPLHGYMTETLDTLRKTIDSADRQFVKPASLVPRDVSVDQIL